MATKPNDDSSLSHRRWNWKYHIVFIPISPKLAVSLFMGYLKGKSSLMIFAIHANLKYKYGNRNIWAKGYFVSTVGLKDEVVREYIRNQRIGRYERRLK